MAIRITRHWYDVPWRRYALPSAINYITARTTRPHVRQQSGRLTVAQPVSRLTSQCRPQSVCTGLTCTHTTHPVTRTASIERVQALADISRSALRCHSQRNPCTDCKSAQQYTTRGHPYTIPHTYIRVRAVWECGEGQTDRHTDSRGRYTFRLSYT